MEFIALLRAALAKLDLTSLSSRGDGTRLISETILSLSSLPETIIKAEVRVQSFKRESSDRGGVVDFLAEYKGSQYAIEVDSANKQASLNKLLYLANQGYTPIWVRWAYPITIEIPEHIHLIDFTSLEIKSRRLNDLF